MKNSKWILVLMMVAALFVGCDDSDDAGSGADASENGGGDNGGGDNGGGGDGDLSELLVQDISLRINAVNIASPRTASLLNSQLASDLDSGILNVMVDMRNFEEQEDGNYAFEITGNAADADGDGFVWAEGSDDVTYVAASFDVAAGTIESHEVFDLDFPAPMPGSDDVLILPLRQIRIDAAWALDDDGVPFLAGELAGVILKEDADEIEVTIGEARPLTNLLGESNLNYPEAGDDAIGWKLRADISASPAQLNAE